MENIISPHGGGKLVNRFLTTSQSKELRQKVSAYKTYTISTGDLSVFYRIADGTLSPLEGPMTKDEFYTVLDKEVIERGKKRYAWTIPIAFPLSDTEKHSFSPGETVAVKTENGLLVGTMEISDIYHFDKAHYNKSVYGTDRTDHPGPRIFNTDSRKYLAGGRIAAFHADNNTPFKKYMLHPEDCRKLFGEKGWERIVAFQTRNPLHRAHEYAIVYAMEELTKKGLSTGVVLNPIVGETKSDDVPASVRMRTYEALIDGHLIGSGDKDEALWKTKGYDITDNLLLVGLDMRMFYAGPKEAIMHAIYRQNAGFTDLIIGRKHADAPFDDGMPAWGDFDAQYKFDNISGELLIKPFKVGTAAYFEEIGRVGLIEEYKGKGYKEVSLSGKELRKKLENGEPIDERVMRRPVAIILQEAYRNNIGEMRESVKSKNITWHYTSISKNDRQKRCGHKSAVIWLTGLSCSGKTTIAEELQNMLFKKGCNVYILDGDNIRHGLNKDLGFSPEDREENIRRISEVAKLFTDAGFIVITAFVSPYKKDRLLARSLFQKGEFLEVFVKADISTCESRDIKGLYKKARLGEIKEFTGISAPYEEPESPELIVDTDNIAKEESAKTVFNYLEGNNYFLK